MQLFFGKETTMRRILFCIAVLVLGSLVVAPRQAQAQDDLKFATPAIGDDSPACESGRCRATPVRTAYGHHGRRRPVVRWFREHRPVRRVLRGVARLVRPRHCR